MKNRSFNYRTLNWKYYCAPLFALLLLALPAKVKAQQFADVTVSWTGIGFNEQCCTDQGLECGFDIGAPGATGDPDPRFAIRGRTSSTVFGSFSVQTPDNISCAYNNNGLSVLLISVNDHCGDDLIFQTNSWEEDNTLGCGSNTTFDVGCAFGDDDDDFRNQTFTLSNYQSLITESTPTNQDFFVTAPGTRRFRVNVTWNSAGPAAPVVQVPALTCLNSPATLTVTSSLSDNNNQFEWYDNSALAGAPLAIGATYITPPLTGNVSYWVAEASPIGCKGQSNRVDLTPVASIIAPSASPSVVDVCEGTEVTLTASSNDPNSVGSFNWWQNSNATGLLSSGNPYTFTATTSTTIYLSEEVGACQSATVPVTVNVDPAPPVPVFEDYNAACWDSPAELEADNGAGDEIHWYIDPAGLNELATGNFYTTEELTQPTFYYTQALNTNTGCASAIVSTLVEVTPQFEEPALDNVSACVSDDSITLRAHISYPRDFVVDVLDFNSFSDATVRFVYNDAILTILGDVPSLLDPVGGVFDAEVTLTLALASSPFATVGTHSFSARVINDWDGNLSEFSCSSDYGSAAVFVSETPAAPTAAGAVICEGQSASLEATGVDGATFTWYDDAGLTHAIQVGAQFNTPTLTTTTSYWVTQTIGSCTSPATEVVVTVNPPADLPFGTTSYTICEGQTIPAGQGLTATCSNGGGGGNVTVPLVGTGAFPIAVGPDAFVGGTVNFDGSAIPLGSTITNVSVTANLIHTFVSDLDISVTSPFGTTVFVHSANGGNDNFGTGGPPPTTAATYSWDDAGPLGPIAVTAGDLNVPVGTYFPSPDVLATFNGEDPNGAWTLDIMDFADLDGGFLNSATLTISYNEPASPGTLTWWDDETGGTQVGSGTPFVPANYNTLAPGAYTFWAQCDDASACTNRRVPVTFTVLPAINAPIVRGDDEVCEGSTATLTVANPSSQVEWYTDPALTTIVHVGSVYTTPELSTTVTYYVVNYNGTCRSAATAWTITVNPSPAMPDVFTNIQWSDGFGNLAVCEGEVISLDIILDDPVNQLALIYTESEPDDLLADWLFVTDEFIDITTNSDMIYYIRALDLNTGCFSKPVPLYINVYPRPRTPDVRGATVCAGQTATIFADLSTLFDNEPPYQSYNIYWAEGDDIGTIIEVHPVSDTSVITNDSLVVGPFLTPGLYSFQVVVSNELGDPVGFCYSYPAVVTVTVLEVPAAPVVQDVEICEGDDVVLTASCTGAIHWYADAGLTELVHVGSQFPIFDVTATTTYYVTCNSADCQSPAAELTVNVNALPEPPTPELPFYVLCYDESGELFAFNTAGDPILWYDDPEGLIEWATDSSGVFITPELTQPAIFYAAAVDPVTGCRSEIVPVQVFTTPKFEHPRVEDIEVCANEDSVTLVAHISFPRDLVVDFFDFFTFSNAIVRFVDNENSLTIFGDAPVLLDPFNDIWEADARLTIPAVTPDWDFTVPGSYDIGARTANFWFNVFTGDPFECSSDYGSGTVTVLDPPATPVVSNTGPVCVGDNVTIFADPILGGIYNWTGPNGFTSNAQSFTFFNVTLAQAGDYTLIVTDLNGCQSDSVTTTLVVNPLPSVDSVYSNRPCEHETLQLSIDVDPTAPYSYQWSGPDGFSSTLEDPTILDVTEVDNQGFYTVIITDTITGCDTMVVVLVQIDGFPDRVIADNDGPTCEGGSITLNATNVFGATYSWTGPNGYTSNEQSPTITNVTPAMTGTYTVTVTLPAGCDDTASTQVVVYPNPVADAGPDDTTYQDDPIVLSGSGGDTYQWTPNTYLDHDNIPNPVFNSPDIGTFEIVLTVWEDDHGCSDKDTVIIVVLPKLDLQIPDLITPNGDGVNDNWIIKYLTNITDPYTLDIYARGGAKVYSTTAYSGDWNGTWDGKELPDGGYWFVLAIEGGKTYKGSITIKR